LVPTTQAQRIHGLSRAVGRGGGTKKPNCLGGGVVQCVNSTRSSEMGIQPGQRFNIVVAREIPKPTEPPGS